MKTKTLDKYVIPNYVFSFGELILRDSEPVNTKALEIYFQDVYKLFVQTLEKMSVSQNVSFDDEKRLQNMLEELIKTKREIANMQNEFES